MKPYIETLQDQFQYMQNHTESICDQLTSKINMCWINIESQKEMIKKKIKIFFVSVTCIFHIFHWYNCQKRRRGVFASPHQK